MSGAVVLVTGASAGIGAAIVGRFARENYRVIAVARRESPLRALAAQLGSQTEIRTLALDVRDPSAAKQAVAMAMESFGRLDCLVNNAGSGKWAPVHATSDDDVDEVLEISVKAPFRFSREALEVMGRGASIINIGSTFGILGGVDGGIYCVAKAGLIGLTQTLAAQYGASGIRSNLVAPGVIRTSMTEAAWEMEPFRRLNQEMTPIHRDGTCEDVANAVYFLASEEGGYINGQTLALDGGWTTTKYLSPEALMAKRVPQ